MKICYPENRLKINYRKNAKIWDTSNNCHNCPKNRKVWCNIALMHPKDADGMANSVDPDQTASSKAVWSWSALFVEIYLSQYIEFVRYVQFKQYVLHVKLIVYYTVSFACNIHFFNSIYFIFNQSKSNKFSRFFCCWVYIVLLLHVKK